MVCDNCGESLCGDGYSRVLHCPNADESTYEDHEPDANPVLCEAICTYKTKRQRKEARWGKNKPDKGIRFFVRRGSLAVLIPSLDPVNAAGFCDHYGNNYHVLFKHFKGLIKGHHYSCHRQPLVDGDWTEIK